MLLQREDGDDVHWSDGLHRYAEADAEVKRIAKVPGIYQWDDDASTWVTSDTGRDRSGSTLPSSPATDSFFKLAEHDIRAEASSGAGSDKVGIAGALALNIVVDQTRALVPAARSVGAGAGDVTLQAVSNEVEYAKASSKAKGATVGVGASLALNIVDNRITRAASRTAWSSAAATTSRSPPPRSTRCSRLDEAGSEGGVSISPSVSIAIVKDQTAARLGTGRARDDRCGATISALGDLLDATLKSDGEAGGENVAIGAAVSVAMCRRRRSPSSRAAPPATRSASRHRRRGEPRRGELERERRERHGGKTPTRRPNDQVQNNPNSQNKTGGDRRRPTTDVERELDLELGERPGRQWRRLAAVVAVTVLIVRNTARVDRPGLTVTGSSGAVVVRATNGDRHRSRRRSAPRRGLRRREHRRLGRLQPGRRRPTAPGRGGATLTGQGITVEAVTPADASDLNDVIQPWGLAARAAPRATSTVAGSVRSTSITFTSEAIVGDGATLISNPGA